MEKRILFLFISCYQLLLVGCGREDEIFIEALGVDFAYRSGEVITEGDCIDPQRNFAVLVHTTMGNFGTLNPQEFDVIINEILYNITFNGEGTKLIPIELKEGENKAKIAGTDHEAIIYKSKPGEFELVE
ncbi:hypothetical protein [Pleomorphovibrio marinus]|uniref:hypothetical protein n=1 Tax=Pleomorphovibrio marinus TaxID=2164132 RepID=UPI000E0CBE45|nr:hypothetical protein [Pleomorphovibrio marinus]